MSIGSISNSISQIPRKINQGIVNIVPEMTISNEKTLKGLKWVGEKVSSPENRLILGVTALMSQPFIDLNNKKVDHNVNMSEISHIFHSQKTNKTLNVLTKIQIKNRK